MTKKRKPLTSQKKGFRASKKPTKIEEVNEQINQLRFQLMQYTSNNSELFNVLNTLIELCIKKGVFTEETFKKTNLVNIKNLKIKQLIDQLPSKEPQDVANKINEQLEQLMLTKEDLKENFIRLELSFPDKHKEITELLKNPVRKKKKPKENKKEEK